MDRFQELRNKEVIDVNSGRRLGFVCDVEIDLGTGRIVALVVPGHKGFGLFSKNEECVIPWSSLRKIGDDIIIVDSESGG